MRNKAFDPSRFEFTQIDFWTSFSKKKKKLKLIKIDSIFFFLESFELSNKTDEKGKIKIFFKNFWKKLKKNNK